MQQVRVVLRALALLQLAKGASAPQIAKLVPLNSQAIRNISRRYRQGGLERALDSRGNASGTDVIPDLKTLRKEARAWNRRMNRDRVIIAWKFDRKTARHKFGDKTKSFKRS